MKKIKHTDDIEILKEYHKITNTKSWQYFFVGASHVAVYYFLWIYDYKVLFSIILGLEIADMIIRWKDKSWNYKNILERELRMRDLWIETKIK